MRVLIVEDDQALCGVFQEFLSEIGHQPLVVHTAEAALEALRANRPDAILLDICLPGMSGLDFLKLQVVRELRVPTVVTSGRVTESQAQECLRLGAFDFIGKPVALQRLAEVLGCLESRPSARRPAVRLTERRRAPRAPVALAVRARERSGAEWESTSADLSTSGIKVHASGSIRPGPEATLTLTLPDGETRLEVASVLVRADLDGYAFYFLHLADWQLKRLRKLVRRSAGAPPARVEPHLRILQLIGQAVSASLDVDEVLRIALDALTEVTGHEISSLHLLSPDGATLHLRGDRGLRPRLREINRELPTGQGLIGSVAASGKTVHWANASEAAAVLPAARAAAGRPADPLALAQWTVLPLAATLPISPWPVGSSRLISRSRGRSPRSPRRCSVAPSGESRCRLEISWPVTSVSASRAMRSTSSTSRVALIAAPMRCRMRRCGSTWTVGDAD